MLGGVAHVHIGAPHRYEPFPVRSSARRFSWLLSRSAWPGLLLIIGMVAVVWSSIGLHLAEQRRQFQLHATAEAGNLAQAAAASINQTLASVDDALHLAAALYASDPKHFDIRAAASRAARTRSTAFEVAIIGPDGILADSSLGTPARSLDFSGQAFFKVQRDGDAERMFISQPILGRASGLWSLLCTRRIQGADGWFMGVAAAAIAPAWLTSLHRALDIGSGTLMLIGNDGSVRAFATGPAASVDRIDTDGIGKNLARSPLALAAARATRGALLWNNPLTGTAQLAAYATIDPYDSYVAVGLDEAEIFAPYFRYARQYEIFGCCLTALIFAMGTLLLGSTRRILMSRMVLRNTMDAISQGVVMIDAKGRIPVINRRARELLHGEEDRAQERPAGAHEQFEQTHSDGTVLEIRTHRLDDGGLVRTYTDITERKATEAKILHLALHDTLTGLPNRAVFADRLTAALRRGGADGRGCAVLWIDLDRFKHINDLRGHSFGDCVLLQVADRLRQIASPSDLLARFGGDEFAILRIGAGDAADVEAFARCLLSRLAEPYAVDGRFARLTASIGAAHSPPFALTCDQLLTNADTALFRAKSAGRATFRLYDPEMDAKITERRLLEEDLRSALAHNEISVHYQPIFNVFTGRTSGFEALARWTHPTRAAVPPASFIQVAEDAGLIGALGQRVMHKACADAQQWPGALRLAVNLSPKQIWEADLIERTGDILADTGLPAERLTLELTESVLMDNDDRALSTITALKSFGMQIALDDFGTGYSSLSYLRRFPFDRLKIDRSFIQTLFEEEGSQSIVQTILALSRNLRLGVVAEGVEQQTQLDWLRSAGCAEVQGYLLGKPMPAEAVGRFLAHAGQTACDNSLFTEA